jgi:oligopeptide transport system ATP-binding protein
MSPADRSDPPPPPDAKVDAKGRQQALLYVQKLTKLYPVTRGLLRRPSLVHALDGVSFYVRHRETFGLVGESGSGKSTLGRCILRLTEPTVGRVVFDGKEVTALSRREMRALRRRMQVVFQDPYASLDPNMTVGEIVREGLDVFRLADNRREADAMVAEMLDRVGLKADMAERYPHQFSGGQRQRIAIARALVMRPEFVVLDEPLSALDLSVQAQIVNLLDDLQQEMSLSMLFISHDLRTVQYFAHRVGVMYLGRIVELGPTDTVARHRSHPYTRALFDAMPRVEDFDKPRRLEVVPQGEPPSALEPPPGCAYFARCPNAEPGKCDHEVPRLRETVKGSHHRVACFHPFVD